MILVIVLIVIFATILYRKKSAPDFIKNFSPEQAFQDYAQLWSELEHNFPAFEAIESEKGIHWREVKENYQSILENVQELDYYAFYTIICECLSQFKGIGHLSMVAPETYEHIVKTVDSVREQEANLEGYAIYTSSDTVEAYDYLKRHSNVVGFPLPHREQSNLEYEVIDDQTLYIKFHSFYQHYAEADGELLRHLFSEHSNRENIILDISENVGGSEYYWMEHIVGINTDKPLTSTGRRVYLKNVLDSEHLGEFKEYFEEFAILDDSEFKYSFKEKNITVEPIAQLYSGNIYIFVGEKTISSADSFYNFCMDTCFATAIGTRSGGNSPALAIVEAQLSHSKLIFRYQLDFTLNHDSTFNMFMGPEPNIHSTDPLTRFKELHSKK